MRGPVTSAPDGIRVGIGQPGFDAACGILVAGVTLLRAHIVDPAHGHRQGNNRPFYALFRGGPGPARPEFVVLPDEKLVLGNIIVLGGDVPPADCPKIDSTICQVDESSLTGAPLQVEKPSEAVIAYTSAERAP